MVSHAVSFSTFIVQGKELALELAGSQCLNALAREVYDKGF